MRDLHRHVAFLKEAQFQRNICDLPLWIQLLSQDSRSSNAYYPVLFKEAESAVEG